MKQLTRNFDMAAILVLVLLLGVAQAPRTRAADILGHRVLTVTQKRIVPRVHEQFVSRFRDRVLQRIQERRNRLASRTRSTQIRKLVFSKPE